MSKTKWTDQDIDAAYLMGMINAELHEISEDNPLPSLAKMKMEIDRLKDMGYKYPHEAVRNLRKRHHE